MNNIFANLPDDLESEVFEMILNHDRVKVERIISKGHATPVDDWYDQDQSEWVLVLQGEALLVFEHEEPARLEKGDYLNIPAHCKHRVDWTDPSQETIWLAIFY